MNSSNKLSIISSKYDEHKLSHIFLIETNNIDRNLNELLLQIANIVKKDNDPKYDYYSLILNNNFPNLKIIDTNGLLIKKEQIQELLHMCETKGVFVKSKYYIINNAELLNNTSANMLLKFIEEPEENIFGFLVCTNHNKVMETITSRCQLIINNYVNEEVNEYEYDDILNLYIRNMEENANITFNKELLENINERSQLVTFFEKMKNIYQGVMENKNYFPGNNFDYLNNIDIISISRRISLIIKVIDMLNSNCNIELTLNYFTIEMGII